VAGFARFPNGLLRAQECRKFVRMRITGHRTDAMKRRYNIIDVSAAPAWAHSRKMLSSGSEHASTFTLAFTQWPSFRIDWSAPSITSADRFKCWRRITSSYDSGRYRHEHSCISTPPPGEPYGCRTDARSFRGSAALRIRCSLCRISSGVLLAPVTP
jgi:hypothetical protein